MHNSALDVRTELHGRDILTAKIPSNVKWSYRQYVSGIKWNEDESIGECYVHMEGPDDQEYIQSYIVNMNELYNVIEEIPMEVLVDIIKTNYMNTECSEGAYQSNIISYFMSAYFKPGDKREESLHQKIDDARIRAMGFNNRKEYGEFRRAEEEQNFENFKKDLTKSLSPYK